MTTTRFASIRVITDDVAGIVTYYERVIGSAGDLGHRDFAEVRTEQGTLAIADTSTVAVFGDQTRRARRETAASSSSSSCRRRRRFTRLGTVADIEFVNEPTTMPWGNRSLLLRDPDGNLVNLFTPVTPEAMEKFGVPVSGR